MIDSNKFIPLNPLNTPILFLIFNRLDTTKQVFNAIQEAKPPRLYIAADGAREDKEGEGEKVKAVREYVMKNIDWDCEVKTLFREKNLGCGNSIKEAIDWFFKHEEMGIILEDDVVPVQSFFWYCEELLFKFANDQRIGMISGNNHIQFIPSNGESIIFSKNKGCWGWATWKRSWKNMDLTMDWLLTEYKKSIIENMGVTKKSKLYWKNVIKMILNKDVDAWDWQWYFSLSSQNQLCIFPKYNLVSNIGFGKNATHTKGIAKKEYIMSYEIELPLKYPKNIVPDFEYDSMFEDHNMKANVLKRMIPTKIKIFLKNILFIQKNFLEKLPKNLN